MHSTRLGRTGPRALLLCGLALGLVLAVPAPIAAPSLGTAANAAPVAATARGSASSYSLSYSGGRVVRWNPCRVIHYRVNLARAPRGALPDIKTAVARVTSASGLRFHYDGRTTTIPRSTYGKSVNPAKTSSQLIIAWAAPGKGTGRTDLLSSDPHEVGVGGYRAYSWTNGSSVHRMRILRGFVVISTRFNKLRGGFGTGPNRGGALLHELGHAVGLGHTSDKRQIMYPTLTKYASYGAGDRSGSRKVGRSAGCIA
jgi:hypothetical protein